MRVVHETDGRPRTLARTVETADSFLSRARGLMFRRSIPNDYALAFRFDEAENRDVHMVFVPFPLDAVWVVEDEVTQVKRLSAWTGLGEAAADLLLELPAGNAESVSVGDEVRLVE